MYELLIERRAEKDLRKLPRDIARLVINKIKTLATEPRMIGSHKLRDSDNAYRIRIGDYRILYEINDKKKIVRIYRIRHRKDVYR